MSAGACNEWSMIVAIPAAVTDSAISDDLPHRANTHTDTFGGTVRELARIRIRREVLREKRAGLDPSMKR